MSEYKRARDYLISQKERFKNTMAPEMMHAMILAIEALEKRTPEKTGKKGEFYICPDCGDEMLLLSGDLFCSVCGKAIEWESEQ